jgi:ATP-binding cassette, subfamily B, bacterial IrtB/YbtQ
VIGELIGLGERLAGGRDRQLRRGLVIAVIESVAIAIPFALILVFVRDALARRATEGQLAWLTLGVVAAVALRLVLAPLSMRYLFSGAHALFGRARIRIADHLRRLPMGFFSNRRAGELAGVVTTDVGLVEDLWSHTIGIFAARLVLPIVVALGLCLVDWRLGLALLATLPLALLALRAVTPIFARQVRATLDATADTNARIVEYVRGIAVLRAFGRHGEGYQRVVDSMARLRDALIKTEVAPAPLLGIYGIIVELGFAAIALVGSQLMLDGSVDAPTLIIFLVISAGITPQIAELGVTLLGLRVTQQALERIDELLAVPPLAERAAAAAEPTTHDVTVDAVTFRYDPDPAAPPVLDAVSVAFPERRLTAIVGASGSGKSTLVHLIARLWDVSPGRGAIRIGGVDVRALPVERLHRQIAMVFQDVVLFAGTIADNIRIGRPDATDAEVIAAATAAQAHGFITALPAGYATVIGETGDTLSGGERQRISIARAILKDAPIVLLDEATASVDASAEAELQRAIDRLVHARTVVVIAHRLRTIRRAHQIVVLDRGRVAETGTHDALIAAGGVYATMWREQDRARGWRITAASPADPPPP